MLFNTVTHYILINHFNIVIHNYLNINLVWQTAGSGQVRLKRNFIPAARLTVRLKDFLYLTAEQLKTE